jgi:hypothetical protein
MFEVKIGREEQTFKEKERLTSEIIDVHASNLFPDVTYKRIRRA